MREKRGMGEPDRMKGKRINYLIAPFLQLGSHAGA